MVEVRWVPGCVTMGVSLGRIDYGVNLVGLSERLDACKNPQGKGEWPWMASKKMFCLCFAREKTKGTKRAFHTGLVDEESIDRMSVGREARGEQFDSVWRAAINIAG